MNLLPTIQDIMTTDLQYYEGFEDHESRVKYCADRDIDFLPLQNSDKIWVRSAKNIRVITDEEVVSSDTYVFQDDLISKFEVSKVLFILNEKKNIVGVVHFSDYRNVEVYTFLFMYLYRFEDNLRYKWAKRKKDYSYSKVNHKYLADLIQEVGNRTEKNNQKIWNNLRNIICHVKETEKHNTDKYSLNYNFDDFKNSFFFPATYLIEYVEK